MRPSFLSKPEIRKVTNEPRLRDVVGLTVLVVAVLVVLSLSRHIQLAEEEDVKMKLAKRMTLTMPVKPDMTLLVEIEDRRVEEGRFLRYESGVVVVMVDGEEVGFDTRNLAG